MSVDTNILLEGLFLYPFKIRAYLDFSLPQFVLMLFSKDRTVVHPTLDYPYKTFEVPL